MDVAASQSQQGSVSVPKMLVQKQVLWKARVFTRRSSS